MKRLFIGVVLTALFTINQADARPITIDEAWQNLPEQRVQSVDRGGVLLFSDSPEMASQTGILYRDSVEKSARLFLYHVNDTTAPKRIVALITNESDRVADVRVTAWAGAEPSDDWLAVGRDTQRQYFGEPKTDRLILAPHETRVLTRELERRLIQPQELVHTIHDFVTDARITVTALIAPAFGDLTRFAARTSVLPADSSHLRGTFEAADRYLTSDMLSIKKGEGVQITLADNDIDRYKWGIDATDGTRVLNYGNYGIVYHIDLMAKGKAAIYLNPQGGLYAGGVLIEQKDKHHMVATPDNHQGYFGVDTTQDAEKLAIFDEKRPLRIRFSPPGASNLPVKLIIIGKK